MSYFAITMLRCHATDRSAVFSAMRTHALTRNWVLTITVFALSLAPLVVNFVRRCILFY